MKSTKKTIKNYLSRKSILFSISMSALLIILIFGNAGAALAQFTFMGDYDRTFGAPNGYFVDPQHPDPAITGGTSLTSNVSGDVMPDGSIITAGRYFNASSSPNWQLWLRKFTPSGAVDASFGGGAGFLRNTDFYVLDPRFAQPPGGGENNSTPAALPNWAVKPIEFLLWKVKALPSNHFLVLGVCEMDGLARFTNGSTTGSPIGGKGICLMRFNGDGTLDTGFGTAGQYFYRNPNNDLVSYFDAPGMVWTPIGSEPGINYAAEVENLDLTIQPDGKILIVGTSRVRVQGNNQITSGFLLRFSSQGARDSAFGDSGAKHHFAPPQQPNECTPRRRFFGAAVQPDGRILALGSDDAVDTTDCFNRHGNRFYVVRWTANGEVETVRYLDNNATFNFQRERATTAVFPAGGNKVIIAGSYNCKATMVGFNLADLSIDTTFGTNGRRSYGGGFCGVSTAQYATALHLKTIQPDGKILGFDENGDHRTVRFNADGSGDQSFGNQSLEGTPGQGGRLAVNITHFNGASNPLTGIVLMRPNGRINLVGTSFAHAGLGITRAVVSQQNTVLKNGNYSDFNNDGKTEIAVYRPADGVWHQLDSRNNNYSALPWGISTDKLAPADYDGDGRTDLAVFRNGVWYIWQSSNGQIRNAYFGAAGDLPRPGDFDGDGLAEIAVFRPANGVWYWIGSASGQFGAVQFGAAGDVPMLGDYDGDGKTDLTVFRPSSGIWYTLRSSDEQVLQNPFGLTGDIPLNGDFNGDGKADLAVFRPADRTWYIARPTGVPAQNFEAIPFGLSTDVPVAADYDNDGKTDIAIYRNGVWWIQKSGTNDVFALQFGLTADVPVAAAYLP